jgi:hypothetical protein
MARASSSLPVPDSPSSRTVATDGAAWATVSMVRRQVSDCPIRRRLRWASSCARRDRFSWTSARFSSAFSTARTTWARLMGLVTKS